MTPDLRRRIALAIYASSFAAGVTIGALSPLISIILEERGVSAVINGLNGAMSPLAIILSAPFMPRLIARIGAVRATLLGLFGVALLIPVFTVTSSLPAWFALRFLIGFLVALPWIISEIWLNLIAEAESRGRVISLYAAALAAGFALGPVAVEWVGPDDPRAFLVPAAAIASAALPILGIGRNAPPVEDSAGTGLIAALRRAPTVFVAALVGGMVEMSIFALLPAFALRLDLGTATALYFVTAFVAGNILLQFPIGWLGDKTDRGLTLGICAVIALGATCLLPFIYGHWIVWPLLMLFGGAVFGFYTVGLSMVGERFGVTEIAAANTSFVVLYEIGSIFGPVASGWGMAVYNPMGYLIVLGIVLGCLALVAFMRFRVRRVTSA